ncbi:MAG: prepilin-type N-terminal cleavage/methylation domain-containing protein [Methylophilaceae bacterium]
MNKQTGFTLIELAIVLVIIGLLLGGVLRGQELINSAKVKNMSRDFQNVQVYVYGYQDKYKALPGDDLAAVAHLGATAAQAGAGAGNGQIGGSWDSTSTTDESLIFWQHVRLAGLAPGSTALSGTGAFIPTNADGGRLGIQGLGTLGNLPAGLSGAFAVCSAGVLGKFAKQLDITLDDGDTALGSMRVYTTGGAAWEATTAVTDTAPFNVCVAF